MLVRELPVSDARAKLPDLLDQVVHAGVPSMISRHGKDHAVLASLDIWRRITEPYAVHVTYLPDEETGEWALWVPELRLHAEGETLAAARADLVVTVQEYVEYYLGHWMQFQYVADRAAELLYVVRLWLARDDTELAHLLFTPAAA